MDGGRGKMDDVNRFYLPRMSHLDGGVGYRKAGYVGVMVSSRKEPNG